MKRRAMTILFACAVAAFSAGDILAAETDVNVSVGYRKDYLSWNIAGDNSRGRPINVLSELTWSGIESYQTRVEVKSVIGGNLYLRGLAALGSIYNGSNQDSDYEGSNRTLEVSRSNNNAGKGALYDLSGGIGYMARFNVSENGVLGLAPVAGYSYSVQHFAMTDGFQTIPATGAFSGLDSSYEARWSGPWIGLDLTYKYKGLKLLGTFEYHQAGYRAEANWNLRSDFQHPKSFEHTSSGHGTVFSVGADYALSERWSLTADYGLQRWKTGSGVDRTYFSDYTTFETQLNGVKWNSESIMAGARYVF